MITLIGVDIGSRYTKVIEIEQKAKPCLMNAFFFPTPYLATQENAGQRRIETKSFFNEITKQIPLNRLQRAKIGINIPDTSIMATSVLLPQMRKKELLSAAIAEARRKMIPVSGPNHVFDAFLLDERVIAKITRLEVFVVRTEKVYIDDCINIFKKKGIIPSLLSPSCCVIINILPRDISQEETDIALIDIGMASINISIYKKGKLCFFRNAAYGFQDIVNDISKNLGTTTEQGERLIKEKGIPQVDMNLNDRVAIAEEIMRQKFEADKRASSPDAKKSVNLLELRMLCQPHIERIAHELRRSLVYYKEQSAGRRVERFLFFGGGAQIKNFLPTLSNQIGGNCTALSPFKDMEITLEKPQFRDEAAQTPIFATAAGLALGSSVKAKKIINFLPEELKKRQVVLFRQTLFIILGIFLIFIFIIGFFSEIFVRRSLRIALKEVEFEISRIKGITVSSEDLKEREQRISQYSAQIERAIKERLDLRNPLKELSRITPEGISWNTLSITKTQEKTEKYQMTLSARVFADYEQANRLIEEFQRRLESSIYFSDIDIMPLELEEISFELDQTDKDSQLTQSRLRDFTLTAQVRVRQ